MKTIKLTTPWQQNYSLQLPLDVKFKFEINNSCHVADYWIIWGGLPNVTTVSCPKENVLYITDEAHELRNYNQEFLNQFPAIASVRTDLEHPNNIFIHEPQIWYFDKTRIQLEGIQQTEKTCNLSMVVSNLVQLEGHRNRFAFANKLIGHFKDDLHVFGRGSNPVADKWQAIAPYKYSVAIENNVIPNYFTEKLTECFLSQTIPIYCGCPNIQEYFDLRSMIIIDINDYKKSINQIEQAVSENLYERSIEYINEARTKVFSQYHLFSLIGKLVFDRIAPNNNSSHVTIYPEWHFNNKKTECALIENMSSHGIKLLIKALFKAVQNRLK